MYNEAIVYNHVCVLFMYQIMMQKTCYQFTTPVQYFCSRFHVWLEPTNLRKQSKNSRWPAMITQVWPQGPWANMHLQKGLLNTTKVWVEGSTKKIFTRLYNLTNWKYYTSVAVFTEIGPKFWRSINLQHLFSKENVTRIAINLFRNEMSSH